MTKSSPSTPTDPWGKMKAEDHSCPVPWDTDWKQGEPLHEVLPMPGIMRFEERHKDGRYLWRLVAYYNNCGHWTEYPEANGGELCGVYGGRSAAENALTCAARGVCFDCLMEAFRPIFEDNKEKEEIDAQETTR